MCWERAQQKKEIATSHFVLLAMTNIRIKGFVRWEHALKLGRRKGIKKKEIVPRQMVA